MPVSHQHKIIFVHVPRTGGSGIEHVLEICGDDNQGTLTPPRPDMLFGLVGNKALQHLTAMDIRNHLGREIYDRYFKFAFVRNPYDRVVSEYHVRQRLLPRVKLSFRDFVLKRIAQKNRSGLWKLFLSGAEKVLEDQFEAQADYVFDNDGTRLVDFIGKYENLQVDFEKICVRAGIKAVTLPVMNRSKHEGYRNYYDGETRKKIGEIYKKDIEAFGYDY